MRHARVVSAVLATLVMLTLPSDAAAQEGECSLDRTPRVNVQNSGTPWEMAFLGGPVLLCPNGMRITADSAVYTAAISEVHFIGRVRFRDPERRLDANYAQYRIEARHLAAQGDVEFVDLVNGSTIVAPTLDYMMEAPDRPEPRVDVYSGRPRTTLISPRAESPADTTIVDSDALTIIGEHTFIGRGDVVVRRGDLDGRGAELEYDQATGSLELRGDAELQTPEYRLAGHTVVAAIEADTIRQVRAQGDAILLAEEIDVAAPYIDIGFADGVVNRLVAVRHAPLPDGVEAAAGPGDEARQPRVVSPEFIMTADSIDAEAPGQRIERLFAVGAAYGERVPTDSAEIAAADTLPAYLARDWVRGDTIVATFTDAPVVTDTLAADTLAAVEQTGEARERDRVLETLLVFGGNEPASSAYRMRDENSPPDAEPTFNYIVARTIEVTFRDGAVERVDAEGDIRGIYITPTAQAVSPDAAANARRPR